MTFRVVCCVLGIALPSAAAQTGQGGVDPQWLPLRAGAVWEYEVHRDQTFDPQWTLDLSTRYTAGAWTFTLGADNVLDSYPDEVLFANSTNGQLPYSATSPNGFNGAFVYGRVGVRW